MSDFFSLILSLSIQALTARFLLSLSEAFMVVRTNLKRIQMECEEKLNQRSTYGSLGRS